MVQASKAPVAAAIFFGAMLIQAHHAEADDTRLYCLHPRVRYVQNGTTEFYIYVKAGTSCGFALNGSGSAGATGILSVNISARPKHGVLGSASIRGYAYKPEDGFIGRDDFSLEVRYENGASEANTTFHATVYVNN
jgi:hypothetical protein